MRYELLFLEWNGQGKKFEYSPSPLMTPRSLIPNNLLHKWAQTMSIAQRAKCPSGELRDHWEPNFHIPWVSWEISVTRSHELCQDIFVLAHDDDFQLQWYHLFRREFGTLTLSNKLQSLGCVVSWLIVSVMKPFY